MSSKHLNYCEKNRAFPECTICSFFNMRQCWSEWIWIFVFILTSFFSRDSSWAIISPGRQYEIRWTIVLLIRFYCYLLLCSWTDQSQQIIRFGKRHRAGCFWFSECLLAKQHVWACGPRGRVFQLQLTHGSDDQLMSEDIILSVTAPSELHFLERDQTAGSLWGSNNRGNGEAETASLLAHLIYTDTHLTQHNLGQITNNRKNKTTILNSWCPQL